MLTDRKTRLQVTRQRSASTRGERGSSKATDVKFQRGQALVIILLILAFVLVVVLSLVARSVTDITISTKEKESSRAFSAAEAGLEQALLAGTGSSGTLPDGGSYSVTLEGIGVGLTEFVWPAKVGAGETIPIWLVDHDIAGQLTCASGTTCYTGSYLKVCWGQEGISSSDSQTPALEVAILYLNTPGDIKTVRVARAVFDPNIARRSANQFASPDGSCTLGGQNLAFGKTINFTDLGIPAAVYNTRNGLQAARIKTLYNTGALHSVAVGGQNNFPPQGAKLVSTGTAESSTRKIEAIKSYPDLPPIFDFVIFSGGSSSK